MLRLLCLNPIVVGQEKDAGVVNINVRGEKCLSAFDIELMTWMVVLRRLSLCQGVLFECTVLEFLFLHNVMYYRFHSECETSTWNGHAAFCGHHSTT